MNKSRLLLFTLLLASAMTAPLGCAFRKDTEPEAKPANLTAEDVVKELERKENERLQGQVLSAEEFSFDVQETELANQYTVSISYPEKEGVRVNCLLNEAPIEHLHPGIKLTVDGGALLKIYIAAYNSAGTPILTTLRTIQVPRDYVVSRTLILEKDQELQVGRLYLENNSTIKTNGHLLSITANKIYAGANSKIVNFESTDLWTSKKSHSGGSISIRAKEAFGFLTVNLHGIRGKNGRSGLVLQSLAAPTPFVSKFDLNGADGEPAEYDYEYSCSEGYDGSSQSCGFGQLTCLQPPTDGEDGEPGPAGTNGEDGSPGGDTGNLFVQIEKNDSFQLKVSPRPGLGGSGGEGTDGRPGGRGGAAGKRDPKGVCKAAKNGKDGAHGPKGKTGNPGARGKQGTIELNGLMNAIIG